MEMWSLNHWTAWQVPTCFLSVQFCFCHLELPREVMSEAQIAVVINKSHIHSVIKYFEGLLCARLACVRSGYYIKLGEMLLVHHSCQKKKKKWQASALPVSCQKNPSHHPARWEVFASIKSVFMSETRTRIVPLIQNDWRQRQKGKGKKKKEKKKENHTAWREKRIFY